MCWLGVCAGCCDTLGRTGGRASLAELMCGGQPICPWLSGLARGSAADLGLLVQNAVSSLLKTTPYHLAAQMAGLNTQEGTVCAVRSL